MTSQKDQIQSLITDIERALSAQRSNKPWVRASDVEPQREALAKAQDYLRSLQQTFNAPGGWGPVDPSTGQIVDVDASKTVDLYPSGSQSAGSFGQFSGQFSGQSKGDADGPMSQSAETVLQALVTEMKYLKSSALEPLRLEMDELRVQRDRLQQEVRSLDEQRAELSSGLTTIGGSNANEAQLNDFLTALMGRLQENLTAQVGQTLSQLEADHAAAIAKLAAADEETLQLRGSGQVEELRQLQGRSDQLLVNIDSTLQRMFDTLQQNINSYQISLNEGIENMHSLGRQGEVIVRSLVDHLTQQLGQTTPPEPAFFPTRSAAVPLVLIDEDNAAFGDDDSRSDSDSMDDTVSSLDEILPDLTSDLEMSDSGPLDAGTDRTVDDVDDLEIDSQERAIAASPEASLQLEDCIREDGTIDLDLLKLDIDREEGAALDPEEVMVDAAMADAQVAATESEDSAIEAKVTPTAESLYLADLTFDDLTVDSDFSDPSFSLASETDEPIGALAATAGYQTQNEEGFAKTVPLETDPSRADVLDVEAVSGVDSLAADEAALTFTDASDAEPAAAETAEVEAADTETTLSAPFEAKPSSGLDDLESDDEDVAEVKLESSLVPDLPDLDGELIAELPSIDEMDDRLSQDLAAELEMASQEAELAAEPIEGDLDVLASDLEEPIVFEKEMPAPERLSESAEPLDSALIPDEPGADELANELGGAEDSLQASLADIETEDVANDLSVEPSFNEPDESGESDELDESRFIGTAASLPPNNFDDDLDFYREDDLAATEESAEEAEELTEETSLNESLTDLLGAAPPILEPPFATPPAAPAISETASLEPAVLAPETAGASVAVPIDPFATADLARSPEEPPFEEDNTIAGDTEWFLGIDIGTTGLSAVLVNQLGEQVYPLCWRDGGDESNRFRLPAIAQLVGQERAQPSFGQQIAEVGIAALPSGNRQFDGQSGDNKLLRHLKPLLKVGIPHGTTGEPWMQWSEETALPLQEIQSALSELLKSLSANRATCRAVGLKDSVLRRSLANLAGVVVGYPTNWPDTYSFNVREAVLAAGLIDRGEQIFFVEEAIAALLSALPDPKIDPDDIDDQQPGLYNCEWSGGTVVLSAGATLTEAAVVDLPEDLEQLSHRDFAMRSFGYAGDALDQDIICQLLHAPQQSEANEAETTQTAEGEQWRSLGLDDLTLPQPGETDRAKRYRLRQRLNASELGREAIAITQSLKVALQEDAQAEVSLGGLTWTVKRKDLETKVFLPYIQRINRQVNALLSQAEMSAEAVKQVVCTGGSASLSAIARWLRQKFPNATIIQDTYSGEYSNSCSRVAYGLANMCNYPNVLDGNRHQYSDYFLLLELLRILPNQPLPAGGILHLLEQRGINTQACQMHILALIEGHLPPGLVPIESDRPLISAQSPDIPTYEAISELPLFRKQGGQIYIADEAQGKRLRQHLENVLASKLQTLDQPQSLQLAVENVQ